jgi:hypothetical protein
MLTWEDDVEVTCLAQAWLVDLSARHSGFDSKTVRKYLSGDGKPGVRARLSPDPFDPFVDYVVARLVEEPHLWARALYDELEEHVCSVVSESFDSEYPHPDSTPGLSGLPDRHRASELGRHPFPPGDEAQWDWPELPDPPAGAAPWPTTHGRGGPGQCGPFRPGQVRTAATATGGTVSGDRL